MNKNKLFEDIDNHCIDWIREDKCKCNTNLKGKRRIFILENVRPCIHMRKDGYKKFDREITTQFNKSLHSGLDELEEKLGRKLPEFEEAIAKQNY